MTRDEFLQNLLGRGLPEMTSRIATSSFISGEHIPQYKLKGMELERTAPFRFGIDDPKDIDWPLSRRVGRYMRRIRSENKENLLVCLIDVRPTLSFGKTRCKRDFALEVGGLCGLTAIALGDRAAIAALNSPLSLPSRFGTSNRDTFLYDTMSLFDAPHVRMQYPMPKALLEVAQVLPPDVNVLIVSDWILTSESSGQGPLHSRSGYIETENALKVLAHRRDIGLIAIHDIAERTLPQGPLRLRSVAGGHPVIANGRSEKQRNALNTFWSERTLWLEKLRLHGIDHVELETDCSVSYIEKLMTFFAQRKP